MTWLGDFPEDYTTIVCMLTTHAADGSPVAPSSAFEAADIIIYKNGGATQKTTTNGVTMTSPFDSITGLHCVTIDISNDTGDTGFWEAGETYTLVLSPDETVDGFAVAKVVGQFRIKESPKIVAAPFLGEFPEDTTTVVVPFTVYDSRGAPVAASGNYDDTDIIIYKNGNIVQKVTTNGVTVTNNPDSMSGTNWITIDTSNDTGDTGFWEAGALYTVVLWSSSEAVETITIRQILGSFRLRATDAAYQNATADALLDRSNGIETGWTLRQVMRLISSVLFGKASGLDTPTAVFRDIGDTKARVTATVDVNGNRTAITTDAT